MIDEKVEGAFFGALIGDAIGKAFEDVPKEELIRPSFLDYFEPHSLSGAYFQSPNEVSDESTIFLLLFESMLKNRRFDPEDFYKKLLNYKNNEKEHKFPDPHLLRSIELLQMGLGKDNSLFYSNTIEGILRVLACALFHYDSLELTQKCADISSFLTHRSDYIKDGAIIYSTTLYYLLNDIDIKTLSDKFAFLKELKKYCSSSLCFRYFSKLEELLKDNYDLNKAILEIGNGSFVFEPLFLSLYIFLAKGLLEPLKAFEDSVFAFGEAGGDTDSIGFITGSFLGAYFGIKFLPQKLIDNLDNLSYYNTLIDMFKTLKEIEGT